MLRISSKNHYQYRLAGPDIGQWLKNRWQNLRLPISFTAFMSAATYLASQQGISASQLSDEQLRTTPAVAQQISTTQPSEVPTSQPSHIQDGDIVSDSVMDNKYPPNFIKIMQEHLLPGEGGYVNNKHDSGGETNLGLTRRKYVEWKEKNEEPGETDMKVIPASHLYAIYYNDYWKPVRADELDYTLALYMFDWAINSGPSRPIKHLQKILGRKVTGKFDDDLMKIVRQSDQKALAAKLLQSRHAFIDRNVASGDINEIFQAGLHARIDRLKKH